MLFRQFRNKDVKELFKYFLGAVAVILVYIVFNFMRTRNIAEGIVLVDAAISFSLHFAIWIKRDIFGDNFGTVVSVITILTTFQWVMSVKL